MASKLRTDFQPGEVFHADYINRANAQTNANTQDLNEVKDNIATTAENAQIATQAATDTAEYMSALNTAMEALPDGQAVTAEVAVHTTQIADLDTATTLGEDSHGNAIKPSDVQSTMSNKEFLEVKTDNQGNLLWTLGTDGKLKMNVPISFESDTQGAKDDRLQNYYTMASKEWIELVLDENDKQHEMLVNNAKALIKGFLEWRKTYDEHTAANEPTDEDIRNENMAEDVLKEVYSDEDGKTDT